MKDIIHIYAQPYWHQCAFVVGDRDSLVRLSKSIDAALQFYDAGMSEKAEDRFEGFTNDGEGYDVHVVCVSEAKAMKLQLPYTDEPGERPEPTDSINPYDLVKHLKEKL